MTDYRSIQSQLLTMESDDEYDEETLLSMFGTDSLEEAEEEYRQVAIECARIFVQVVGAATLEFATPLYNKIPYHTSALSGLDWVLELMNGHPKRIRNELGMHKHVFDALLEKLKALGFGPSRNITLKEQLAIFLYTCVTGLSIRHVGKRFQHTTETTSQ